MARARGSYPRCHWFDSSCRHQETIKIIQKKREPCRSPLFVYLFRSSRGTPGVVAANLYLLRRSDLVSLFVLLQRFGVSFILG